MSVESTPPADPLARAVQFARGVGPQRAALLAKLDLHVVRDLLFDLPRSVLDFSKLADVPTFVEGKPCSVRGRVVDRDARVTSGNRTISSILIKTESDFVRASWFNQPYMLQKFQPDQQVILSGKPALKQRRWEFSHPQVQWLGDDPDLETTGGILPVYSLTDGLKQYERRRIAKLAVEDFAAAVPDPLPELFRTSLGLMELKQAVVELHNPSTIEAHGAARKRLLYDDLLEFQVGLALRRRSRAKTQRAAPVPVSAKIDARIRRLFPFELTAGQEAAVREISADLASSFPMHRLLQADVGAGKTVVAIYAMLAAVAHDFQAVIMAPTELLAQQHWRTIDDLLRESRVNRKLLTGQLSAANRRRTLEEIRTGEAKLVVGTQAVIQSGVSFQRLAVAVIDEQHKFGVLQRAAFTGGELSPHVLVMTATPIPRSLCLTQFGDLDLTAMNDLPPGRQRVVTSRIFGTGARDKMWQFLREQIQAGRQLYVVCPRIGTGAATPDSLAFTDSSHSIDEADDAPAAEQLYQQLTRSELRGLSVGLVHGRQDRAARQLTMDRFRNGELQAIVSTTVIEVGVDVPNATLMAIFQADSFGLSQLHQLRGRVGRGKRQGYCFLVSQTDSPDAIRRIAVLESTSDGFKIAEADFEQRGPGDVLGIRQHGELPLRVADLVRDQSLLKDARTAAFELVGSGMLDSPEFAPLKIKVLDRFSRLMDLPQTG